MNEAFEGEAPFDEEITILADSPGSVARSAARRSGRATESVSLPLRVTVRYWSDTSAVSTRARMPRKKNAKKADAQSSATPTSVLPMQLRVGDRFTDETGEWEVASRPYGMAGGKTVRARVQKVGEPAVTEGRTCGHRLTRAPGRASLTGLPPGSGGACRRNSAPE
jgi:hypothetical protein